MADVFGTLTRSAQTTVAYLGQMLAVLQAIDGKLDELLEAVAPVEEEE